jgi:hypothetical protein
MRSPSTTTTASVTMREPSHTLPNRSTFVWADASGGETLTPSERATRSARVCQLFRCMPTLFFETMSATTEVAGIGLLQVCLLTGGWEDGGKSL